MAESAQRIRLAALRVPLAVKLVGANALVVSALVLACALERGMSVASLMSVVAVLLAVHGCLVIVALRPIRDLENTASRVWYGDFGARVTRSSVADHQVLRLGAMFNILLDGLVSDRARMRALANEVIIAGDRERSALANELENSIAQHIAALQLQLAVAARDVIDPALADPLSDARDAVASILDEVRTLSSTVYPGVLEDLGLEAALRKLARESSHGNGIDIDVHAAETGARLPRRLEAVLYRVATEAVRNATRHGSPRHVELALYRQDASATLEVHDDGRGFDLAEAERRRTASGLLSMRERLALVDGSLDIKTARGNGTTVCATVPLEPASAGVPMEIA